MAARTNKHNFINCKVHKAVIKSLRKIRTGDVLFARAGRIQGGEELSGSDKRMRDREREGKMETEIVIWVARNYELF